MWIKKISRMIPFCLFCNFLCWISVATAGSGNFYEKVLESAIDYPILTPRTYTEPISRSDLTVTISQDVTPENTSGDLYEQILPSREPTTPLSRNFVYEILKNDDIHETPSTLATTIHAPPPYYKNFK